MKPFALCLLLLCSFPVAGLSAETKLMYKGKIIGPQFHKAIDLLRRSDPLIKEKKFQDAKVLLQQAVELAPEYEEAAVALGYVLIKTGQPQDAIRHLQGPVDNNTDDQTVWLALAEAYANSGRTADALIIYECFQKRFPQSPYKDKIKSLQAAVKAEQARVSAALKESDGAESANLNDYYKEATAGRPKRWPAERMPLPVYIKPGVGVKGWRSGLDAIARASFAQWAQGLERAISFRFVDDPADAVVELSWVDDVSKFRSQSEKGETHTKGLGSTIVRAHIDILTVAPSGKADADDRIALTCLHEIGHALGISGHSVNPGDVMYFAISSAEKLGGLSQRDINTLRKIYLQRPIVSNKTEDLHAAGAAALDGGDFVKATQIFSEILKSTPDLDSARINLALSLSGLALQLEHAKKADEAEKLYKQVLSLREVVTQPELLNPSLKNYAAMLKEQGRLVDATNVENIYRNSPE